LDGSNLVATRSTSVDRLGLLAVSCFEPGGTYTGVGTRHQAVTDALGTLRQRLAEAEHALSEARDALATAEAAAAATPDTSTGPPAAYTIEQVAQTLALSRSTIAEMVRRGEIRSVKLGGSRRVFRADLDAYIAAARDAA
jgi:excisionase family DNA binding protein